MTNSQLSLRRLNHNDIDGILNLQKSVIAELKNTDNLRRNTKETFEQCLIPPSVTIGLFDGNDLIGMAIMAYVQGTDEDLSIGLEKYEAKNPINMKSVMIRKAYYGMGFQRSALAIMERIAEREGFQTLCATVSPDNLYSRNNIIRNGYMLDHTAVKYGGMRRDVFVKKIDLSMEKKAVMDRAKALRHKQYEKDEILRGLALDACYCGTLEIATAGDIIEYCYLNSAECYFGLYLVSDTEYLLFRNPESGQLQKRELYACMEEIKIRNVWIKGDIYG